jgi:hypothetical protein
MHVHTHTWHRTAHRLAVYLRGQGGGVVGGEGHLHALTEGSPIKQALKRLHGGRRLSRLRQPKHHTYHSVIQTINNYAPAVLHLLPILTCFRGGVMRCNCTWLRLDPQRKQLLCCTTCCAAPAARTDLLQGQLDVLQLCMAASRPAMLHYMLRCTCCPY